MFALHVWSQVTYKARKDNKAIRRVRVFTRLGGVFVGWVTIKAECTTLLHRVQDLQSQVARIFRHPTRTSNYLKLFINNFELPSFTYSTTLCHLPQTTIIKATKRFSCDPESLRLECMYDEDDSHTLKQLERAYRHIFRTSHIYVRALIFLMPELRVLRYTHDPKRVEIVREEFPNTPMDLSVLASFTNLRELVLSGVCVESWEFAKHLPLKRLELDVCKFPSLERKCFESLEELDVYLHDATNFVLLERPDNLKAIKFLRETAPSFETLRSLSTSFPDLHLVDITHL
jgi:hypothetical protein